MYIMETHICQKHSNIEDCSTKEWDAQTRMIEYSSWEDYIKLYEEYDPNRKYEDPNTLHGCRGGFLSGGKFENLQYDDHKLFCWFRNHNGKLWSKTIACIVYD